MRTVLGTILLFVVSANSYALDCSVLSESLVGVPLDERVDNLEGYVKTEYVIEPGLSMISFWKRRGDIQESIKIYYSEGEVDRLLATYRGFSKKGGVGQARRASVGNWRFRCCSPRRWSASRLSCAL